MAIGATRAANSISRRLGFGSGTVAGGRLGLALDPSLVRRLGAGRTSALVSGTNGKTTTTRLLAVALEAGGCGPVVTNATGSNMPAGHLAALAVGRRDAPAVLEVDEGYLPALVEEVGPGVVVLLNLSRDQLDRTNEVRMLAARWRGAFGRTGAVAAANGSAAEPAVLVANADDPLVVWGVGDAPRVRWVAVGLRWRSDAVGCPACGGRIVFTEPGAQSGGEPGAGPGTERGGAPGGWSCECGFGRPAPHMWLEADGHLALADGRRLPVDLRLPGEFNRANAVMATAGAEALGVAPAQALLAMAAVGDVAGRFTTPRIAGVPTHLLLAKNPAGWVELLRMLGTTSSPVVVSINARVADGRDPSWLWDVPFEKLAGRTVVATGERCLDLAVRLLYAEVPHETVRDPVEAVLMAARAGGIRPATSADGSATSADGSVESADGSADYGVTPGGDGAAVQFIGNYTAFHDVLARR